MTQTEDSNFLFDRPSEREILVNLSSDCLNIFTSSVLDEGLTERGKEREESLRQLERGRGGGEE